MKPSRHCLTAAACLLLAAGAAASAAPRKQGFEAYALLRTRNIFDPERQPGVTASAAPAPTMRTAPGRTDFAALTGILVTSEKTVAFFSGTRPEYNGVLPAGRDIAGARITLILPDAIEIERGGKRTLVAVGQTVPLDAASAPTAAPASASAPAADTGTSATAAPGAPAPSSTPAASAPAPSNRDEIIRRMMEKRQKELQ